MKSNIDELSFLRDIITNIRAIVYVIDLKTMEYIWNNGRFYDVFGYEKEDIIKNVKDFAANYIHPDDVKVVNNRFNYINKALNKTWSGVYRVKHKKGHWVWVYSKISIFKYDKTGYPIQIIGLMLDAIDNFRTLTGISALIKERLMERNSDAIRKLTIREVEIISLITVGHTYKEIANHLCIQPDTVNKHRKNILEKLNLNNVASLINFANKTGLNTLKYS